MISKTQTVHNELKEYFKKTRDRDPFPIIYVSPEFFNALVKEDPLELDTSLGKYAMTFEKYSMVIKKKYADTDTQIHIV